MDFRKTAKQTEAIDLLKRHENTMLYGGSGSAKTFIIVYALIVRAMKCANSRHGIMRLRFKHAKASIWRGTLPDVLRIAFPNLVEGSDYTLNNSDHIMEFRNGSEILIGGMDDKDRVEKWLGTEFTTIFFNECSQFSDYQLIELMLGRIRQKNSLTLRAFFDQNPPSKKHWSYQLFLDDKNPVDGNDLPNPDDYACLLMNPKDNEENLPDAYIKRLKAMSKRQRDRFWLGKFASDVEGALWSFEMIAQAKAKDPGDIGRTVVSIDPATTDNKDSDETGLVVTGKGDYGPHVIEDRSGKYTPEAWASLAIRLYEQHRAVAIVVEKNQGGDMVKTVLKDRGFRGKIVTVHTTKGKFTRAEPVQAMYERGEVSHAEGLELLEDEMQEWVPDEAKFSPNRIDALVQGIWYLYLKPTGANFGKVD